MLLKLAVFPLIRSSLLLFLITSAFEDLEKYYLVIPAKIIARNTAGFSKNATKFIKQMSNKVGISSNCCGLLRKL